MKKLLLIAGILISWVVNYAQTPPIFVPRSGPAVTAQDYRLAAKLNLYMPHTHGLTLNGGLDTLGAVIYDDSSTHVWYRDTVVGGGHKWSMILKTGDAGMGTVMTVIGGYGLLPVTITTSGTLVVDTAGLSNYWVRRHDSTIVFVTPTQMNSQGFLKTITGISVGGDLTGTLPNPSIAGNAVTFAKMQQIPGFTFIANPTASPANPQASYFGYGLRWNNDTVKVDTTLLKLVFGAGSGPAGITQLNGDGAAGPGSGNQTFTLSTVNSNVFGSNTFLKFAVNAKGLILSAATVGNSDIVGALGFTPISLTSLSAVGPISYNNATGVISCPSCGTGGGDRVDTIYRTAGKDSIQFTIGGRYHSIKDSTASAGSAITQLTGDGTAGPGAGSQVFTLATVNSNVGSFGSASSVATFTTNAKGLTTAAGSTPILITESQVTNLVTDLAGKQAALSGTGYLKFASTTPSYLTPTQVTADLNLFSTSLQGLVPASGGGTTNFLRADGTWAAPPGGGGSIPPSIGSGFRIYSPQVPGFRSLFCVGCTIDSTTNTNALTLTVTAGGSGTVTNVAIGNLSPLFTTVVSNPTASASAVFTLSNAAANTAFGNFTGSSAAPSFGKVSLAANANGTNNSLFGYDGSGVPTNVTAGPNINISAGVISSPSNTFPAEQPISTIYSRSNWHNSLTEFGTPGGNAVLTTVTGYPQYTSTAANWSNVVQQNVDRPTSQKFWTDTTEIQLLFTPSASSIGLGPAFLSIGGVSDLSLKLYLHTTISANGTLELCNTVGGNLATGTGSCTNTINDIIRFIVTRNDSVVTFTATNLTTGSTSTGSKLFSTLTTGGTIAPNVSNWGYLVHGPSPYRILRRKIVSTATRNPYAVFLWDSKGEVGGTSFLQNAEHRINTSNPTTVLYAAPGSTTSEMLKLKQELLMMNPTVIICNYGSNDIRSNVPLSTVLANLQTLCGWFKGSTTKVYLTVQPEDSVGAAAPPTTGPVGLTALKNWEATSANQVAYGFSYIDVWTALTGGSGNVISASFVNADKIHPNQAGIDLQVPLIQAVLPANPVRKSAFRTYGPYLTANDSLSLNFNIIRRKNYAAKFDSAGNMVPSVFQDGGSYAGMNIFGELVPQQLTDYTVTGQLGVNGPRAGWVIGDRLQPLTTKGIYGIFGNDNMLQFFSTNWGSGNAGIYYDSLLRMRVGFTKTGSSTRPTAYLTFSPSDGTAGNAPIKIDAGTLLVTPENGAIENNGTHLFVTLGGTRFQLDQQSGGSGVTTVGTFSGSSQTNGASIATTTITFGPADGTNPGMVSIGAQTFAGAKNFTSTASIYATNPMSLFGVQLGTNTSTDSVLTISAGIVKKLPASTFSGGGSPGGSNTQVQFNNSGAFSGSANLTWASNILTATNMAITTLTQAGVNDSTLTWDPVTKQIKMRYGIFSLKVANGLTPNLTQDSLYWGGTLNQTTTVANAGFGVTFSGTGILTISSPLALGVASPGDANYTVTSESIIRLATALTANRVLTLPSVSANIGRVLTVVNYNAPSSAFSWTTSPTVFDATGTGFYLGRIPNGATIELFSDGSSWVVRSFQPGLISASTLGWTSITTGTSSTAASGFTNLVFNPASVIASYTLTLPAVAAEGQLFKIHFGGTITSGNPVVTLLTISPNSGQTLVQAVAPSSGTSGDCIIYQYNSSISTWYRER
jgi:lysophospholipase L1-like esterase